MIYLIQEYDFDQLFRQVEVNLLTNKTKIYFKAKITPANIRHPTNTS